MVVIRCGRLRITYDGIMLADAHDPVGSTVQPSRVFRAPFAQGHVVHDEALLVPLLQRHLVKVIRLGREEQIRRLLHIEVFEKRLVCGGKGRHVGGRLVVCVTGKR